MLCLARSPGRALSALASVFLRIAIVLYRHSLSLFLGRSCRFLPTCSAYADEAIRLHGPWKGSTLAIRRVCRCHPWGGQGFDPVPPAQSQREEQG